MAGIYVMKGKFARTLPGMTRDLWHYSIGERKMIAIRICLGISRAMIVLAVVWSCRLFIDVALSCAEAKEMLFSAVCLLLLFLLSVTITQLESYLGAVSNASLINRLRLRLQSALLRRKAFDGKRLVSGDLTCRLEQDVPVVSEFIARHIPQAVTTMAQLVGAFVMMRHFNPALAWILLLGTPVIIICGKKFGGRIKEMSTTIRKREAEILSHIQEWNENVVLIKCSGNAWWLQSKMEKQQEHMLSDIKRRTAYTTTGRLFISGCFGLAYIFIFIWGGHLLRTGEITFGTMTSFLQLTGQIQYPMAALMNLIPVAFHASASIDRLNELEKLSEIESEERKEFNYSLPLAFKDVAFSYRGDGNHVVKMTHTFMPGTTTAITGESGKGKTTLLRLMLGLVKPTQGVILLGDKMVGEDTLSNFNYIPQGNTLMHGTIRENLLLGNPSAKESDLWDALHIAVADFVNDLDAECQEKGGGLSEGMAQRIAIARGLLQPGRVMLFDEVSSALDLETERELFRRLIRRFPKSTMIFVTHSEQLKNMCQYHLNI